MEIFLSQMYSSNAFLFNTFDLEKKNTMYAEIHKNILQHLKDTRVLHGTITWLPIANVSSDMDHQR